MKLHNLQSRSVVGFTTFGSIWDKGEVKHSHFVLTNDKGKRIPVQSRVSAWWPDGSVKWAAHTARAEEMGKEAELTAGQMSEGCGPQQPGIVLEKQEKGYQVKTGCLSMWIPKANEDAPVENLAERISYKGSELAGKAYPILYLEHPIKEDSEDCVSARQQTFCPGEITSAELEEEGPLQCVFCFRGIHKEVCTGRRTMPFVIRLYLWQDSPQMKLVHTFQFDGKEEYDYLKGLGVRFDTCLSGGKFERHVQFCTDKAHFHEEAMLLVAKTKEFPAGLLKRQLELGWLEGERERLLEMKDQLERQQPVWNRYSICQESAYHYCIQKQTKPQCCRLVCAEGKRAPGVMAVTGTKGGISFGIRDFWQKYPSGLEIDNLGEDTGQATVWFYSPDAGSFDFRHYDTQAYPDTCYEGYPELGADAVGIGVTSECRMEFHDSLPTGEQLMGFAGQVQKPPVYVGTPEYYHQRRAFGYWSLPAGGTSAEDWLEKQLSNAFRFYQQETEARSWYGLFNYGDIMHSYDPIRHVWKYDVGGFAWQNTELVPTYWLWLYFLRTGREDVYSMAEAMSRHTSEVDVYHFGRYQGLGSRHNVRHWGCPCKEPRIAMAGHHRFLYYLTGDERLKDIFRDVKDADKAMARNVHYQVADEKGTPHVSIRSGPDWSSFVSDWMTWYEITLDEKYRQKIETGIADIANTPYGFASGPDYYYDPERAHLIYHGEIEDTPNQHLQICMGGPQIWLEVSDMLEEDALKKLLISLGSFYFLPKEEKSRITNGQIRKRSFGWPMLATSVAAYSALKRRDKALARQTWEILLREVTDKGGMEGYQPRTYAVTAEGTDLLEIPWNSTNSASQWCLNVIMCLEFIKEELPNQ